MIGVINKNKDGKLLLLQLHNKDNLNICTEIKVKQYIEYPGNNTCLDTILEDGTPKRFNLYDIVYGHITLEEKYNEPTTERYPGKYASENGKWYFSCDTGDSALVGAKTTDSTCPLFGIINVPVTMEQLVDLEDFGEILIGPGDSPTMYSITTTAWNNILRGTPYTTDEDEGSVVFCTTDSGTQTFVIRFHIGFE